MGLLKTKVWSAWDIALLKWSSILFGMILGAYSSVFVKRFLWVFIVLIAILAIRPVYSYWFSKDIKNN